MDLGSYPPVPVNCSSVRVPCACTAIHTLLAPLEPVRRVNFATRCPLVLPCTVYLPCARKRGRAVEGVNPCTSPGRKSERGRGAEGRLMASRQRGRFTWWALRAELRSGESRREIGQRRAEGEASWQSVVLQLCRCCAPCAVCVKERDRGRGERLSERGKERNTRVGVRDLGFFFFFFRTWGLRVWATSFVFFFFSKRSNRDMCWPLSGSASAWNKTCLKRVK